MDSFNKLKEMLISSKIMAHPTTDKPFKLYTDACDYCIGAVLVQDDEEGIEKVVQYVSHKLGGAQLKWATIEKEGYAVIYALQKLRHYLYGAKFRIFTDHRPLLSMFSGRNVIKNQRVQRWALLLSEFQATIEYRPGKINERADFLSRIHQKTEETDIAIIDAEDWVDPDALPEDRQEERLPLEADNIDKDLLIEAQQREFKKEIEKANHTESLYQMIEGLLFSVKTPSQFAASHPRLVLPAKFRETVINRCHKEVGHMSSEKTLYRVLEAYVWKDMRTDIRQTIAKCVICKLRQKTIGKNKNGGNASRELSDANY